MLFVDFMWVTVTDHLLVVSGSVWFYHTNYSKQRLQIINIPTLQSPTASHHISTGISEIFLQKFFFHLTAIFPRLKGQILRSYKLTS